MKNIELEYLGHGMYGLYIGGELVQQFDDYDKAYDAFEESGGSYKDV